MTKETAALVAAFASMPVTAAIGNRIAALTLAAAEPVQGFAEALMAWPLDLLLDPLYISLDPYALLASILGAIVPLIALSVWLMQNKGNKRIGEEHGSARIADPKELAGFAGEKNPDPEGNSLLLTEHVGMALSRDGFSRRYDRNLNVLVIGGSGAGKTRYYVKPNVGQLNCDIFVTDPKADLVYDVGDMLVDHGYELRCFNTFLPHLSRVYNPLAYVHTQLDVLSFAHTLVAMTEDPGKTGGDAFWTKSEIMLYTALISYLVEYASKPEEVSIDGILKLLDTAEVKEGDDSFESGLDLIFKEIETGMKEIKMVPKGSGKGSTGGQRAKVYTEKGRKSTTKIPSSLVRRSDGKKPYLNVRPGGQRGFSPAEDFSLRNYKNFKQAAGKTLKSILISCAVRLAPFTTSEVRAITSGLDQMHLERLGGERTGLYDVVRPDGTRNVRSELTDREAAVMRASGMSLTPYFQYRVGERELDRKQRRRLMHAQSDRRAAEEVLETRVLQMKANCGLLDDSELERAAELGIEAPGLERMREHNEAVGQMMEERAIDVASPALGADALPESEEVEAMPEGPEKEAALEKLKAAAERKSAKIARDAADAGVLSNSGRMAATAKKLARLAHRNSDDGADAEDGRGWKVATLTRAEAADMGLDDDDRVSDRPAPGEPRLDTKNAVFAIFKDVDQRTLGFLHGIMVYQTINILCEKAIEDFGGHLPRTVNFILDEYRSLSLPEDISAMISVVRSRNIAMSIILQGVSQLGELYKTEAKDSIIACCDSTLYLGSNETETKKYVSDMLGTQTVYDENYSTSHGQSGSWSKSGAKHQRPLMTPDEVGRLPNDKAILQIRASDPTIDDKIRLEEKPIYHEMDGSRRFDLVGYQREQSILAEQEERLLQRLPRETARRGAKGRGPDPASEGRPRRKLPVPPPKKAAGPIRLAPAKKGD